MSKRSTQLLTEFSFGDIGRGLRKAANWDPTRFSKTATAGKVAAGEQPAGPDAASRRAFDDLIQAALRTNLSPSMKQFAKDLQAKSKGYKLPAFNISKGSDGLPKQPQAMDRDSTQPAAKKPLPAKVRQPMQPASGLGPAGSPNLDNAGDTDGLDLGPPGRGQFDTSDVKQSVGNDDKPKKKSSIKDVKPEWVRPAGRLLSEMFGTRKGD